MSSAGSFRDYAANLVALHSALVAAQIRYYTFPFDSDGRNGADDWTAVNLAHEAYEAWIDKFEQAFGRPREEEDA